MNLKILYEKIIDRCLCPFDRVTGGFSQKVAHVVLITDRIEYGKDHNVARIAAYVIAKSKAIRPGHGGTHGHFPDFQDIRTGYVACGPGIKKGAVIEEMNQRDQAVIVAKLLRLSLPSADGKIPVGLLTK